MPTQTFPPSTHTTPYLTVGGAFTNPTFAYDGNTATAATCPAAGNDHDILFLSTGNTTLRGRHASFSFVTFDIDVTVNTGSPAGTWYVKCINNGQTLLSSSAVPYTRTKSTVKITPYFLDLPGNPLGIQIYSPNYSGGTAIMSIYEVTFIGTSEARVQVIG